MTGAPDADGLSRLQAGALLLLVALIWGSAFVGQSVGMAGVGPLTFTGVRFMLGAMVVLPLAWREHARLRATGRPPGRAEIAGVGALGALLFAGVTMQQVGLLSTTVTNAGFLAALYVPLVPMIAWTLRHRAPGGPVWLGAVGCSAGTWLMTGAAAAPLSRGDLWIIASSVPWALHVLTVGRIADRLHGPFRVACGQFIVCAALSLALGLAVEPVSAEGLREASGALLYCGIVSVGVGFTLQVIGQRRAHPADAAVILSSETVFAAMFGAWFMGDRLDGAGLCGAALILASILAVQLRPMLAAYRPGKAS